MDFKHSEEKTEGFKKEEKVMSEKKTTKKTSATKKKVKVTQASSPVSEFVVPEEEQTPKLRCSLCGHVIEGTEAPPVCPWCKKRNMSWIPV